MDKSKIFWQKKMPENRRPENRGTLSHTLAGDSSPAPRCAGAFAPAVDNDKIFWQKKRFWEASLRIPVHKQFSYFIPNSPKQTHVMCLPNGVKGHDAPCGARGRAPRSSNSQAVFVFFSILHPQTHVMRLPNGFQGMKSLGGSLGAKPSRFCRAVGQRPTVFSF